MALPVRARHQGPTGQMGFGIAARAVPSVWIKGWWEGGGRKEGGVKVRAEGSVTGRAQQHKGGGGRAKGTTFPMCSFPR